MQRLQLHGAHVVFLPPQLHGAHVAFLPPRVRG
jgi:hypothetical protein